MTDPESSTVAPRRRRGIRAVFDFFDSIGPLIDGVGVLAFAVLAICVAYQQITGHQLP
ncbi:hypothetical protein [Curtobacterium sp. L1-20]|uniref:hypothetical protein n=1 Tax=Curtobacterium sp. L1-20 TaxID=3138181 RepID=UPI003B524C0D